MLNSADLFNEGTFGAVPAEALDLVSRLAACLMGVPYSIVGVLNNEGGWTNYTVGLGPEWKHQEVEGARELFGSFEVRTRSFKPGEHPIEGVRFSAGIALPTGAGAAALLVLDRVPRHFRADDIAAMESLRSVTTEALRSDFPADFGSPADLVLHLDMNGRISATHPGAESSADAFRAFLGANILDLIPPAKRDYARDRLLAQFGTGTSDAFELEVCDAKGATLLYRFRTRLLFEGGNPSGILAFCRDLTTPESQLEMRRETQRELRRKTDQLALCGEHLRELLRLNTMRFPSIDKLYLSYLAAGCAMLQVRSGLITDSANAVVARYPPNIEPLPGEHVSARVYNGEAPFGLLSFGPLERSARTAQDSDLVDLMAQSIGQAVLTSHLQHERDVLNLHLQLQLRQDPLTGLPNRLGLFEWLERAVLDADCNGSRLAILFCDLDRFKRINDTLGHATGDDLLVEVARRLSSYSRPQDHVARMGGDEFTFIITGVLTLDEITRQARVLLEGLQAPYMVNDYELFVTASIGITVFPDDGVDPKTLIQQADAAMYRAKNHGKNDFEFFTADVAGRGLKRFDLESQLRHAIDNGELEMRFQPIFDLALNLKGLEALLAWNNPRLGRIGPSRFIPIAEESGIIVPLGIWVLEQACRTNAAWQAAGHAPLKMSVNVSALQFARADFVERVAEALRESGMPPNFLELELTESLVMGDVEQSATRMRRLRDLGVSIAIDDFGTGYSSLSYLKRLPVDTLKIDKSFVAELSSTTSTLPVIQTIVVLAHNMGLSAVAEGVENEQQLSILRSIDCDKVQGHLFGEALKTDEVPSLLRRMAHL